MQLDGIDYEVTVGGSGGSSSNNNGTTTALSTSTPVSYALHGPTSSQQTIQDKNALIALYQERVEHYESELNELNGRLSESQLMEREIRER